MKHFKIKCPDCNKLMVRNKQVKEFWWSCSGYPKCGTSARDYKGKPHFLTTTELLEKEYLKRLNFIKYDITDLKALILIRLIQNRGGLNIPEKHMKIYNELIEPILLSTIFTKCHRCLNVLNAENSLKLDEDTYLCDWCWSH